MKRGYLLSFFILFIALVYIGKLFSLQVLNHIEGGNGLNSSTVKKMYDYPERGYIYDRNGMLLVTDKQSYNLKIIPREVKELDTNWKFQISMKTSCRYLITQNFSFDWTSYVQLATLN